MRLADACNNGTIHDCDAREVADRIIKLDARLHDNPTWYNTVCGRNCFDSKRFSEVPEDRGGGGKTRVDELGMAEGKKGGTEEAVGRCRGR